MIKGTFTEAAAALAWFEEQIRAYAQSFDSDYQKSEAAIRSHVDGAQESIKIQRDAVGGWWMNGGSSFYSVQLVACPNFFRLEYACPQPPG
nr:hypothetical protein [Streptomyces clavuligerus]